MDRWPPKLSDRMMDSVHCNVFGQFESLEPFVWSDLPIDSADLFAWLNLEQLNLKNN